VKSSNTSCAALGIRRTWIEDARSWPDANHDLIPSTGCNWRDRWTRRKEPNDGPSALWFARCSND